jgi:hypothetical protein
VATLTTSGPGTSLASAGVDVSVPVLRNPPGVEWRAQMVPESAAKWMQMCPHPLPPAFDDFHLERLRL